MDKIIEVVLVDGYCFNYCIGQLLNDSRAIRPKLSKDFNIEDFCQMYDTYFVNSDGYLEQDKIKAKEKSENIFKLQLRYQREVECFPIINRGKLWYDNLTPIQLNELQNWYQAWLDVTETLQIPETPSWINESLN